MLTLFNFIFQRYAEINYSYNKGELNGINLKKKCENKKRGKTDRNSNPIYILRWSLCRNLIYVQNWFIVFREGIRHKRIKNVDDAEIVRTLLFIIIWQILFVFSLTSVGVTRKLCRLCVDSFLFLKLKYY